jgi:hypothetical protein
MIPAHTALLARHYACSLFPAYDTLADLWSSGDISIDQMLWGAARLMPHAASRFVALADVWAADWARNAALSGGLDAAHYAANAANAANAASAAHYAASAASAASAAHYAASAAHYAASAASAAAAQQRADIRAMFPEMRDAIEYAASRL